MNAGRSLEDVDPTFADRARVRVRSWLPDLVMFALTLALTATWVLAIPRFASPDESGHVFKAYGTAHGQLLGIEVVTEPPTPSNFRLFDGPPELGSGDLRCYVFLPDVPAGCEGPSNGYLLSTAATYPPFYYAVVGGAARLTGQSVSMRAYRLASATLCAAGLAVAFALTRRSKARHLTPLLMAAVTPMALFMMASVNPNGFEIAGFVLLWALLLRLGIDEEVSKVFAIGAGTTAGILVLCRPISAAWLVCVAAVVVIAISAERRRQLFRWPVLIRVLAPLAISGVGSLAWLRYSNFELTGATAAAELPLGDVIRMSAEAWPEYYQQTIGVLGWLDTRMPWFVYAAWSAALLAIVALCCWFFTLRRGVALAALIVAWLALPIVINATTAGGGSLSFQGRYSLPVLPGLVFLAMLDGPRLAVSRSARRVVPVVLAVVAVAEIAGFWQMVRRFSVGADGKVWLTGALPWTPAVAPMSLIAINAIVMTGVCVALSWVARWTGHPADEQPRAITE